MKHHAEVETLRRLYGPAFIAVGVYTPYRQRLEAVRKRLRESAGHGGPDDYGTEAQRLIDKDFDEQNKPFGQHASDAFALADVVVSTALGETTSVTRFIELLFGDWTHTPTRDECGMTHAQIAAYRSSSMARQVGAAICRPDGSLVATGFILIFAGIQWFGIRISGRVQQVASAIAAAALVGLVANLFIIMLAFAYSGWLSRKIGTTGLRAISKIVSMLLAAIAVNMIRRGWAS